MVIYSLIHIALVLFYAVLMIFIAYWWKRRSKMSTEIVKPPAELFISVIIVARNEESTIKKCLGSIFQGNLSPEAYEVLVIDDHSSDRTAEIVRGLNFPNLRLLTMDQNQTPVFPSFKKQAIEFGISQARGPLIALTDADCEVQPGWLVAIRNFFALKECNLVTGPVAIESQTRSLLENFQVYDMIGTMAFTHAGMASGMFHLANGANLAFRKSFFTGLKGFEGNRHRASGDDVFLAQKVAALDGTKVHFLLTPEALVHTYAIQNTSGFVHQRIRWASKSFAYSEYRLIAVICLIFAFYASILTNVICLICGWTGAIGMWLLILQIGIKFMGELFVLQLASPFFGIHIRRFDFVKSFGIQWIYYLGIGLGAIFVRNYIWKGRRVY